MKLSTGLKLVLLALDVLLLYSSATLRAQKTIILTVCPAGPPDCHFQKIQDAINVAIEGSTIQVKSGTYGEDLTIIYKGLTLQGEGKSQVTIQGTVAFLFTKSVIMSGFTIKDGRAVYIESNSEKIELRDNDIIGMALEGIYARGAIAPIIVQNNNISGSESHGILLSEVRALSEIKGNTIVDNKGEGIKLVTSQANIYDNVIASNIGCGVWADDDKATKVVGSQNRLLNWTGILGGGAAFWPKGFWMPLPLQERKLSGHTDDVTAVAYSPYGGLLASGSWDKTVKVWDTSKGNEVRTLSEHGDPIKAVAFSADGMLLASSSADRTIKLWEVVKLRDSVMFSTTLSGHNESVEAVVFSPCKRKEPSRTTCIEWDKLLASGSFDTTIKLWDIDSRKEVYTFSGHNGPVYSVAFSPDGKFLASGSADNTIKLWDVVNKKEILTLSGHSGPVYSVVFSPDGKLLASGSADGTVKLWKVDTDKKTGNMEKSLSHDGPVKAVAFSSEGKLLAASSIANTIKLWEVATGKELQFSSTPHDGDVNAVAFNPICKQTSGTTCTQWELASGSADKTVKLWKVEIPPVLRQARVDLEDFIEIIAGQQRRHPLTNL